LIAHIDLHAPLVHANGEHPVVFELQVPTPSQENVASVLPLPQVGFPHTVLIGQSLHTPPVPQVP